MRLEDAEGLGKIGRWGRVADRQASGGGTEMKDRGQYAFVSEYVVAASVIGVLLMGAGGCASEPPKPAPTVTPDQVRGHADKAFDKLKQEEQGRSADSTMPR